MYNTTKKMFAALIAVAVWVLSANAADFSFKNPIQVVAQDKTSVSITWDKLPGANGYIVMYGSKSSTWGIYDNELPDVAETNSATISGLKEGQKVFIAVTAIDSNFNEGATSAELAVTIGEVKGTKPTATPAPAATPVAAWKFSIQKVDVVNELEVKVTFSGEVENYETSVREFAINKKSDKNNVINVVNSRVENKNQVVLELASSLDKDTEYELVAISISDVNGNTIQSGTDGLVTFTAPSVMATSETLNAANPETPVVDGTPVATAVTATGTDAATAAAQAEALPKTGPREMMIVLLALMLGWIVVFMRRKA